MNRTNEQIADSFDLDLDRLARRAYELRETDERWRQASIRIDAARAPVRLMMSKADREKTAGHS